jgi:hypothetical protein
MSKYSSRIQTQLMLVGALDDGRKPVNWATERFLKAHTAANEFYGQVGQKEVDQVYWERTEDTTMERPAYKIDKSKPGKIASRYFFRTSKSQLSTGESTACAKCPPHSQF